MKETLYDRWIKTAEVLYKNPSRILPAQSWVKGGPYPYDVKEVFTKVPGRFEQEDVGKRDPVGGAPFVNIRRRLIAVRPFSRGYPHISVHTDDNTREIYVSREDLVVRSAQAGQELPRLMQFTAVYGASGSLKEAGFTAERDFSHEQEQRNDGSLDECEDEYAVQADYMCPPSCRVAIREQHLADLKNEKMVVIANLRNTTGLAVDDILRIKCKKDGLCRFGADHFYPLDAEQTALRPGDQVMRKEEIKIPLEMPLEFSTPREVVLFILKQIQELREKWMQEEQPTTAGRS